MKYKTIGAFKNVQNVPYCKAASDLMVGMGVLIDRVAKTATLPASADEAKTVQYIVTNICDKPDVPLINAPWKVLSGEHVRADDLATVDNMEIEFADTEIDETYADLAVGDTLVFGTSGTLEVAEDVTGYRVYFEVIEKTAYMGAGILAVIHVQCVVPAEPEENPDEEGGT